jgi:hypothetical protein
MGEGMSYNDNRKNYNWYHLLKSMKPRASMFLYREETPKHIFLATGIQGIRAYQVIDAIKRRKARSHIAIGLAWGR